MINYKLSPSLLILLHASSVPTKDVRADKDESDDQDESKAGQQAPHKAWVPVEGSAREQEGVSAAAEREALVKAFCWSTTTQRYST